MNFAAKNLLVLFRYLYIKENNHFVSCGGGRCSGLPLGLCEGSPSICQSAQPFKLPLLPNKWVFAAMVTYSN